MDLRKGCARVLELYANRSADGVVHGKHRLSPRASPKRADSFLSSARSAARFAGTAVSADHFAASTGNLAMPEFESVGCPSAANGAAGEDDPPTCRAFAIAGSLHGYCVGFNRG